MSTDFLDAINWGRPWLAPYRQMGQALAQCPDWRERMNAMAAGIRNGRGHQITFVPQSVLPLNTAYESFIAETGMVPTRDNLHDFFNALVWLTFPGVKRQLNDRQAAEILAAGGISEVRGRVRDAATLFDENAALLVVSDPSIIDALRSHRWDDVFMKERSHFSSNCEVILFGHALMEKLVSPYKAITAHAWPIVFDRHWFSLPSSQRLSDLDDHLAGALHGTLAPACFTPLPVLGVPGWCEGQDPSFYADASVFRPPKRKT